MKQTLNRLSQRRVELIQVEEISIKFSMTMLREGGKLRNKNEETKKKPKKNKLILLNHPQVTTSIVLNMQRINLRRSLFT